MRRVILADGFCGGCYENIFRATSKIYLDVTLNIFSVSSETFDRVNSIYVISPLLRVTLKGQILTIVFAVDVTKMYMRYGNRWMCRVETVSSAICTSDTAIHIPHVILSSCVTSSAILAICIHK